MKIIGCVGYHGTGAGVIDDLLREFDNIAQGAYECESRFLHDADGISDLEYNLVENPHRLNSGLAIMRFLEYAKKNNCQLSKVYGSNWLKCANEYAKSITKFEYEGYKGWEVSLLSPWDYNMEKIRRILNKLKPKKYRHQAWYNYHPRRKTLYALLDEEDFLMKTQEFVHKLSESIPHTDKDDFVMMDQLIPGNNTERYLRYIADSRIIIVDRDPRDLYIRQRSLKDHVLPNDVYQFCEYYKGIRPLKDCVFPNNVMFVMFEDMIYKYDEMVAKILDFLEITSEHHVSPRTHFDPSKSIKGTRMWERYPEYAEEMKVIEKMLPSYLYNNETFMK